MEVVAEQAALKRKSFIFGNLALAGSWVLFVLALALAAFLPERLVSSNALLLGYSLVITLMWFFYFIPYLGSSFQDRFQANKWVQHIGLFLTVVLLGLLLWKGALLIPFVLVILVIALMQKRSAKNIALAVLAGIGDFAAIANTVLLGLLLKALLLGEWLFAGVPFRCDIMLAVCGVLALAGLMARGKLLSENCDWKILQVLRKPLLITVWSVLVVSVIATIAADKIQAKKLEAVKTEAEKLFNAELSAEGMQKFYFNGQQPDGAFYSKLAVLSGKINSAMRVRAPWRGKGKGKDFRKPSAEEMKKFSEARAKAFEGLKNEYAELEKMLAGDLPKYPMIFADGNLAAIQQPYAALVNRACFALLSGIRYAPEKAVVYSKAYFKLVNALNCGTGAMISRQNKLIKFWCGTVRKQHERKIISDAVYKELQALAKTQAASMNTAERGRSLAYLEMVFAYDLYRSYGQTTISATGAFFKYDRTEALRALLQYAKTNQAQRPDRGIAKKINPAVDVLVASLNDAVDMLNEI